MKYKQQLPENCHSANTNTLVESGLSRGKVYVDKKTVIIQKYLVFNS